jgi:hypothetical protein
MKERVRRPDPERTAPRRATTSVLDGLGGSDGRPSDDEAPEVTRSIGQGYRIVEEYLEQSRRVASQIAPGLIPDNLEEGLGAITSRFVRTTAEMFELWFQILDASNNSRQNQQAAAAAANGAAPAAAAQPASPGVTVQIQSRKPARVTVDIRASASGRRLAAHALRSIDDSLPRIDDIRVDASREGEPVLIAVRVRDDQPAGVYNGMVIDEETSLPAGTVSVVVEDEA